MATGSRTALRQVRIEISDAAVMPVTLPHAPAAMSLPAHRFMPMPRDEAAADARRAPMSMPGRAALFRKYAASRASATRLAGTPDDAIRFSSTCFRRDYASGPLHCRLCRHGAICRCSRSDDTSLERPVELLDAPRLITDDAFPIKNSSTRR